ncbi:MAG TPA: hypothetical protein VGI40_20840 [Pirellulaceae bacterium]|jgi:hypothetical protein
MSEHDPKAFLHTAAEIGAVAAGVGALLAVDKLGRIESALREAASEAQWQRDREQDAIIAQKLQEAATKLNRDYLARVANEDNWFAPPPVESKSDEPEAPPVICAPPRNPRG